MQHIGCGDKQYLREVKGNFQVMVSETIILFRINTSKRADAGSPLKSEANLSISSRTITGLRLPTVRMVWIMRPGMDQYKCADAL